MKKILSLILLVFISLGLIACSGQYGYKKVVYSEPDDIITQLSQEATPEKYSMVDTITSTDDLWINYLDNGVQNQKNKSSHWLDNNIVTVLPEYYFTTLGTHTHIGTEWGFYVHTTKYDSEIYTSDVLLFDVSFEHTSSVSKYTLSVKPVMEYQYRTILNYEYFDDTENRFLVLKVGNGTEYLNRYFLSSVKLTVGTTSANHRNNNLYADHISHVECYFDAQLIGNTDDTRFLSSVTPNNSDDYDKSIWKLQEWDNSSTEEDPTNHVEFQIDPTWSTQQFYFDGWLESATFEVHESYNMNSINYDNLNVGESYFPGQFGPASFVPIEYPVGDTVPSAIALGMERTSKAELYVSTSNNFPSYTPLDSVSEEDISSIWVSNEVYIDKSISLDILYRSEDNTLIKMAEIEGEHRDEISSEVGDTLNLFESAPVKIQYGDGSTDFRFYVQSDGNYYLMNSGSVDNSVIYIIDSQGDIVYQITEGMSTVYLQASKLYYVVAKYQDVFKTGDYWIAFWQV